MVLAMLGHLPCAKLRSKMPPSQGDGFPLVKPKGCFTGNKLLLQFQIPPSLLLLVTAFSSLLALPEPKTQETKFEGRLELSIADLPEQWTSTDTVGLWSTAVFLLAPLYYKSINDFSVPLGLRFNSL